MNILILSNVYPPHDIGGYELGCQQIALELLSRGHQVTILTSTYGVGTPQKEGNVYRQLHIWESWHEEISFMSVVRRELYNQKVLLRVLDEVKPDLVYFFNMGMLPASLIFLVAKSKVPYSLYISDNWLANWKLDAWYQYGLTWHLVSRSREPFRRVATQILCSLGYFPFDSHASWKTSQFTSEAIRQRTVEAGLDTQDSPIIHWGVATQIYRPAEGEPSSSPYRLLYVGRIVPDKGFHILLDAFEALKKQSRFASLTLTVVGGFFGDDGYEQSIKDKIAAYGLADAITFTGKVGRESVAQIYRDNGILVFSSIWDEPFSITLVEAMSSGLAIVSTETGGTREILVDKVNALIYEKESPLDCAEKIAELITNNDLFARLSSEARRVVESKFAFSHMVDVIESELSCAVKS